MGRLAAVTSAERGKYVAFATLGTLLGPTLSPILGGLISQYAGWHWMYARTANSTKPTRLLTLQVVFGSC